jgi:hypothetical protein
MPAPPAHEKNLLLALLLGGVYWWMSQGGSRGGNPLDQLLGKEGGDTNGYIEITDLKGRVLNCRVVAKRASFVQIERQPDQKLFIVALNSLDDPSRQRLEGLDDFNPGKLDAGLYELAKANTKAELLYSPELCYYRCPHSGDRMLTESGYVLDHYRAMLRDMGVRYRETVVSLKKTGDAYYLPEGISELPCVRIGTTHVFSRSPKDIQNTVINHYLASN